jgi:Rad3-related DNA helicase
MAGRLLRGPDDRGVLCLVDDRFLKAEFQRFFPRHWQPEAIRAAGVGARIEKFWQATSDLPRLVDSRATAALPAVEDPP